MDNVLLQAAIALLQTALLHAQKFAYPIRSDREPPLEAHLANLKESSVDEIVIEDEQLDEAAVVG